MRYFIILLLIFSHCLSYGQETKVLKKIISFESPHHKLLSKVFKKHFIYPYDLSRGRIKIKTPRFNPYQIWEAAGENKQLFTNLVNDTRVNLDFRLSVYWVLRIKFGKSAIGFFNKKMLAQLFYYAFLAENYYEHWSFPRESYPPFKLKRMGEFAEMLIELGDISIPFWYKELNNNKIMLDNSADGVYMKRAQYNSNIFFFKYHRNDYAAFYLSQITKIPLPFHQNYEERVKEIIAFKTKIKMYCVLNGISLE